MSKSKLELMVIRGKSNREAFTKADVTPVVLAGGLGSRLRTVVSARQKVVAEVSKRPFLNYVLEQIRRADFERTVLCVGHMAEQVEEMLGADFNGMELSFSVERALLGTAGALSFALPQVKTEWLLVLNGDSFCDLDINHFVSYAFAQQKFAAAMALVEVENRQRYGSVELDTKGRITSFLEKGSEQGPGLINAGVYLIRRNVIESIPKGRKFSLENEVFPKIISEKIIGYDTGSSQFIDIGTPESFAQAQEFFGEGWFS